MAIHLTIRPLKTHSGLEPVERCEPSTCQPIKMYLLMGNIAEIPTRQRGYVPILDIYCVVVVCLNKPNHTCITTYCNTSIFI